MTNLLRPQFSFLPAIVWAILIDSIDLVGGIGEFLLTVLTGGLGIPIAITANVAVDFFQGAIAVVVFENPIVWGVGTGSELLLISGIDLFPSYSVAVIALQKGDPQAIIEGK